MRHCVRNRKPSNNVKAVMRNVNLREPERYKYLYAVYLSKYTTRKINQRENYLLPSRALHYGLYNYVLMLQYIGLI